jgi:hypothetical protein
MNENPGLEPTGAAARDLIRRKQLGRLGTRRTHRITVKNHDDARALIPLDQLRAVHKRQ